MASQQHVKFDEMVESAIFRMNLFAEITKAEEGGYVAYCPTLDVCSQGETLAETKSNIKEAIHLFIESSYKLGTLNSILKKCGFRGAVANKKSPGKATAKSAPFYTQRKSRSSVARLFRIPAEIPLHVY